MQLRFDDDVEAFRAEFAAFLDANLPSVEEAAERPTSTAHMPAWTRRWQRLLFDNGWLLPTQPPEFGGRNATVLQQYVYLEELCRRRIYHSLNPQGVNIVAASLISFGTEEQKQRWAVPILRAEITASLLRVIRVSQSRLDAATRDVIRRRLFEQWLTERREGARIEWFWGQTAEAAT